MPNDFFKLFAYIFHHPYPTPLYIGVPRKRWGHTSHSLPRGKEHLMRQGKSLSKKPLIPLAHLPIGLILLGEAGYSILLGKACRMQCPTHEPTLHDQHLGR